MCIVHKIKLIFTHVLAISFVDCVFYSFWPVFLHFQLNGVFALSKDKAMFCSMPSAYSKGNITFISLNKEIKQYGWYFSYNIPVGCILKPVCSYSSHSSYLFPFATLLFSLSNVRTSVPAPGIRYLLHVRLHPSDGLPVHVQSWWLHAWICQPYTVFF